MPKRRNTAGRGEARQRPGAVRIIGGTWRGRKLPVADAPGLRPSGDRVRETLFNWLQTVVPGSRCADPFAGTGALGFEAASRGASRVTLVERSQPLAAALHELAHMLGAKEVSVIEGDGVEWLADQGPASLDLVFIDPPFDSDLAERALEAIATAECLAPGGLVYLESPRDAGPSPPGGYLQVREKCVGEVRMQLLELPALQCATV